MPAKTPLSKTISNDIAAIRLSNDRRANKMDKALRMQAGPDLEERLARGGHAIMRDVVKRIAALLDRQASSERAVADKYACYGWGDSMERQLNDEITNSQY